MKILLINENIIREDQRAEKLYFSTGKVSGEGKQKILSITNGDVYTTILAELVSEVGDNFKELEFFYNELKNYNPNVFPIKGFENINSYSIPVKELYNCLVERSKIKDEFKQIPSIGVRNMKDDIRTPRNYSELHKYQNDLNYFVIHLGFLSNRSEEIRNIIYKKMFKSNTTLYSLLHFVEEKDNLIGGVDVVKDEIIKIVHNDYDMELVYDENNIIVVQVESSEAIKKIGCNSLWCFTYGKGSNDWYQNSYNGIVYVIFNFNVSSDSYDFSYVIIKPIDFDSEPEDDDNEETMYYQTNQAVTNPLSHLDDLFGLETAKEIFTFDY